MNEGADRCRLIRHSIRAFVSGMIGLVPIVGFPVSIYALVCWRRTRKRPRGTWNPAAVYGHTGAAMAVLGILLTVACASLLVYYIYNRVTESWEN